MIWIVVKNLIECEMYISDDNLCDIVVLWLNFDWCELYYDYMLHILNDIECIWSSVWFDLLSWKMGILIYWEYIFEFYVKWIVDDIIVNIFFFLDLCILNWSIVLMLCDE